MEDNYKGDNGYMGNNSVSQSRQSHLKNKSLLSKVLESKVVGGIIATGLVVGLGLGAGIYTKKKTSNSNKEYAQKRAEWRMPEPEKRPTADISNKENLSKNNNPKIKSEKKPKEMSRDSNCYGITKGEIDPWGNKVETPHYIEERSYNNEKDCVTKMWSFEEIKEIERKNPGAMGALNQTDDSIPLNNPWKTTSDYWKPWKPKKSE